MSDAIIHYLAHTLLHTYLIPLARIMSLNHRPNHNTKANLKDKPRFTNAQATSHVMSTLGRAHYITYLNIFIRVSSTEVMSLKLNKYTR